MTSDYTSLQRAPVNSLLRGPLPACWLCPGSSVALAFRPALADLKVGATFRLVRHRLVDSIALSGGAQPTSRISGPLVRLMQLLEMPFDSEDPKLTSTPGDEGRTTLPKK